MQSTPRGLRSHVAVFGKTNSGKSSLFNNLIGQDSAIVSEQSGTTTDPVLKNIELIPYGPITLIDTAGVSDKTYLGEKRTEKTKDVARRVDLGIYVYDALEFENDNKLETPFFKGNKIIVFSKCDLVKTDTLDKITEVFPEAVCVSNTNMATIEKLKKILIDRLTKLEEQKEDILIGDLVSQGDSVIMVIPIDSAAPKGRLILPQVECIRDCLDHGIHVHITRETELKELLEKVPNPDLVVIDSQAFKIVNEIVPKDTRLTSFSILQARKRGNFAQLLDGVKYIDNLKDNDKVLILEGCTHNKTHEDIGRIKIPKMLDKSTGKNFVYDFYSGYDIPKDITQYSFVIQCGSCMLNKAEVTSRLRAFEEANIPVTNYGVILAYFQGILERCQQIFIK